jgi:hypothetical protein
MYWLVGGNNENDDSTPSGTHVLACNRSFL